MYCPNCGTPNEDSALFCQNCGTKLEPQESSNSYSDGGYSGGNASGSTNAGNSGKVPFSNGSIDLDMITEMVAGAIGFGGLLLFVIGIVRAICRFIGFGPFWILLRLLYYVNTILVWVLLLAAIGEIVLLVLAFTKRQKEDNTTIFAGIGVSAAILLMCILNRAGVVYPLRLILGAAAAVAGFGLLDKVFLTKEGLHGPYDLPGSFASAKEMFKKEETVDPAKYTDPNIPQYALTPEIESDESYFDGTGAQLIGMWLLSILISALTCGLAAPWINVKIIRWRKSHTIIQGHRLSFNGTAAGLFGHWVKWILLSVITCGIYAFFAYVDYQRWETKHTCFEGEEIADDREYQMSFFDGGVAEYIGYSILGGLLTGVTCGLGSAWATTMLNRWLYKSIVVSGKRFFYDGTGGSLFGTLLLQSLLTVITCGIYAPWAICAVNRYVISHTHIDATYQFMPYVQNQIRV